MPKNTQNISRSKLRKNAHNKRVLDVALSDEDACYGRAIKALGNCRFRIVVPSLDPKERRRLIECEGRIAGNAVCRVQINDIIVVAKSGITYEILGTVDSRSASKLEKENVLHPALLTSGESDETNIRDSDMGFEFDYTSAQADVDIDAI